MRDKQVALVLGLAFGVVHASASAQPKPAAAPAAAPAVAQAPAGAGKAPPPAAAEPPVAGLPPVAQSEAPPAAAEPTAPPSAVAARSDVPQGKIDLTTRPPDPVVPRTYRRHDGFYVRASIGFGTMRASFDDDDSSGENLEGSGGALGFDLMVGGSPSPGVAIGGALLTQGSFSLDLERTDQDVDRGATLLMIGPFIDGFFDPNKGWHFGGALGVAAFDIEDDSDDDGISRTGGFAGAMWAGYDFWVADEWSVGPMIRLNGALTRNDDDDTKASSFSTVFLFTALYH